MCFLCSFERSSQSSRYIEDDLSIALKLQHLFPQNWPSGFPCQIQSVKSSLQRISFSPLLPDKTLNSVEAWLMRVMHFHNSGNYFFFFFMLKHICENIPSEERVKAASISLYWCSAASLQIDLRLKFIHLYSHSCTARRFEGIKSFYHTLARGRGLEWSGGLI